MGEHLPCKQGVESSNLLVSISRQRACEEGRTLKTEYQEKETSIRKKKKQQTSHPYVTLGISDGEG